MSATEQPNSLLSLAPVIEELRKATGLEGSVLMQAAAHVLRKAADDVRGIGEDMRASHRYRADTLKEMFGLSSVKTAAVLGHVAAAVEDQDE